MCGTKTFTYIGKSLLTCYIIFTIWKMPIPSVYIQFRVARAKTPTVMWSVGKKEKKTKAIFEYSQFPANIHDKRHPTLPECAKYKYSDVGDKFVKERGGFRTHTQTNTWLSFPLPTFDISNSTYTDLLISTALIPSNNDHHWVCNWFKGSIMLEGWLIVTSEELIMVTTVNFYNIVWRRWGGGEYWY